MDVTLDPHQGTTLTAQDDASSHGNYHLVRISTDHFRLTGPDNRYPRSWVTRVIGDGQWWTDWAAGEEEEFVMDIRRC